jgi:hypothetical protein
MSEMCQLAKQDRKRWNFHSTCQTLSRFALKLGFCRFYIPRNDRIVLVRVFLMRELWQADHPLRARAREIIEEFRPG